MEYVWFSLLIVAMVGMWWLAYRMEPHWSTKDGRRFMCTTQDLSNPQFPGRKRETRVVVTSDGALRVTLKNGLRRRQSVWTLIGKSPDPPKRLQVYVAQQRTDGKAATMMSLRVPAKSRVVPVLDAALAGIELD
ncbi:MAG: hypothetical protein Q7V57_05100 [Actinomycetota bacterium]|nr:hypothetical protein [Actinomycetota bacterium]